MNLIIRSLLVPAMVLPLAAVAAAQSSPETTASPASTASPEITANPETTASEPRRDIVYGFFGEVSPKRVRDAVSRSFDARQAAQRAEVERLRRELREIEVAMEERERQRKRIIETRVRELLQYMGNQHPSAPLGQSGPEPPPGVTMHAPHANIQYGFERSEAEQSARPEDETPDVDELTYRLAELDVEQQKLERLLMLTLEEREVREQVLKVTKERFTAGDGNGSDVDQARLQLLQVERTLASLEAEHRQLRIRFQRLSKERDQRLEKKEGVAGG